VIEKGLSWLQILAGFGSEEMASRSRIIGAVAALVISSAFGAAAREPISDAQVRQAIIQDSIARYQATGHPTIPLATDRGAVTGAAYSRPGGASPLCFPQDVSDGMVADWRRAHP
jgi:hypothetical protein